MKTIKYIPIKVRERSDRLYTVQYLISKLDSECLSVVTQACGNSSRFCSTRIEHGYSNTGFLWWDLRIFFPIRVSFLQTLRCICQNLKLLVLSFDVAHLDIFFESNALYFFWLGQSFSAVGNQVLLHGLKSPSHTITIASMHPAFHDYTRIIFFLLKTCFNQIPKPTGLVPGRKFVCWILSHIFHIS